MLIFFFFSSRRRHTRYWRDWSSDVCSSDLLLAAELQPAHECCGLLSEPDAQEAVEGKGGVPDPGVAIVPVALAADTLWQAGCGSRDDRSRRLERQELERQCRAVDHLAPAAGVGALRKPPAPIVHGQHEKLFFFGPRNSNAACGS